MRIVRIYALTTALLVSLFLSSLSTGVQAQTSVQTPVNQLDDAGLQVSAKDGETLIDWSLSTAGAADVKAAGVATLNWPTTAYNGYELPMRLVAVQVDDIARAAAIQEPFLVRTLDVQPWAGELRLAAPQNPPDLPADEMPDYIQPTVDPILPEAPVFVLREGRLRGRTVRVVAISPVFVQDGVVKLTTRLQVAIPGATPLTDGLHSLAAAPTILDDVDATAIVPPNLAATQNGAKLIVSEQGMQVVTGQMLAVGGLDPSFLSNVGNLGLSFQGQPVALEIRDDNHNGRLDANETLRFYAEAADDYWNEGQTYWLTANGSNVIRMETRNVAPDSVTPQRSDAYESGVWRDNKEYSTLFPGPNRDHWFAGKLQVGSADEGKPEGDYPAIEVAIANQLPPAGDGETRLTVKTLVYKLEPNVGQGENKPPRVTMRVRLGNAADDIEFVTDSEVLKASATDWITTVDANNTADNVKLILLPPDPGIIGGTVVETASKVYVDEVEWRRKVQLDFRSQGAIFQGVDGTWRYSMRSLPNPYTLYDITDSARPAILTGLSNENGFVSFQDSSSPVHHYLVSGPGIERYPIVEAHSGTNILNAMADVDAIYIAPNRFHVTLQRLVDHRRGQSCWQGLSMSQTKPCNPAIVDVQDVYDAYGYGQIGPEAIRAFLQAVYDKYGGELEAVTLVGDGNQDPKNYEERDYVEGIDTEIIPPYLAYQIGDEDSSIYVDPFIRRTGCENCFGQLDGDDPLTGDDPPPPADPDIPPARPGSGFLPDIMVGRMPVKNTAELRDLVTKILRYETEYDPNDPYNEKLVFLADNYVKSCDPNGPRDTAGNFVAYTEGVIDVIPESATIERVYYDPTQIYDPNDLDGDGTDCNFLTRDSSNGPFEGNPWWAYQKALGAVDAGGGLFTYNGHSSQWRYAVTERDQSALSKLPPDAPAGGLDTNHLFYIWDVDSLDNDEHPFIGLSMTCLTSQFHKPIEFGMTLDEHMILHERGGAVATWGSTGLSVAQGHDLLQQGFHRELWRERDGRARMGELTMAGYLEQFTESGCCDDVRRTFMVMGDPLTLVRVGAIDNVYLPAVAR